MVTTRRDWNLTADPKGQPVTSLGVILVTSLGVIWAGAALASCVSLAALARVTGWDHRLAWLLPVIVDATAVASMRVWLTGPGHVRGYARSLALGAVLASVAGNAMDHAVSSGRLSVTLWLTLVVGSTPPLAVALVTHLLALLTRPQATQADLAGEGQVSGQGSRGGGSSTHTAVPVTPDYRAAGPVTPWPATSPAGGVTGEGQVTDRLPSRAAVTRTAPATDPLAAVVDRIMADAMTYRGALAELANHGLRCSESTLKRRVRDARRAEAATAGRPALLAVR